MYVSIIYVHEPDGWMDGHGARESEAERALLSTSAHYLI
jgi:hypothetical protein